MGLRIGVDVGGTFTDLCLFDDRSKLLSIAKVPSTPNSPDQGVLEGVRRILADTQCRPEDVEFFVHGTTIATNAIIEYKGAKVGLLVTEGFRDVLQIVRQDRPKLYDYFAQHATPLVPRRHTFEVRGRMLFDGQIKTALDEPRTRALIRQIKKAKEVDILAVCLLHSYANPAHELRVRELIKEEMPHIKVSLSCEILPEIKEYERTITTVVNAYVSPTVNKYLSKLKNKLGEEKIGSDLYIMQSSGGVMTAVTAVEKSVHTVLSGPAAGALAAMWMGKKAGFDNLISIDMGGTSADVSLMNAGKLAYAKESTVAGHVIKVPTIDINSVGAGGGSIAWVDSGGALQVGPASAGASPGPACYKRGGTLPTVTDANVILGRMNPECILGGEMKIDVEAARRAIHDHIAAPLKLSLEKSAEGIIQVVNATMVRGIRRVSVEKGYDPREFTLYAFGGGGPLHAASLAVELNIPKILIPTAAGVGSAMGCIVADFRHDYTQTHIAKTLDLPASQLQRLFGGLEKKALTQMQKEGVSADRLLILRNIDMRYSGQGYELEVPVPSGPITSDTVKQVESIFRGIFRRAYGYEPDDPTQVVTFHVIAVGNLPEVELPSLSSHGKDPSHAVKGRRKVYFDGQYQDAVIYDGQKLGFGNEFHGPAIIEQRESTTLVLNGQHAEKGSHGELVITAATK
ncbi:MAG TPA: hydantoinase/oxoprolinase family protein [Candidatus Dormibacteraeota bacterium]|nr:hydantoinase/oxoprolinase family protein [Candidatus Dormibacteraeota bacterium]